MVMGLAATGFSNARTPGSFTDTLLKWIFIFIAIVVIAIIGTVIYFIFFSDVVEKVTEFDLISPLLFITPLGGFLSFLSRL